MRDAITLNCGSRLQRAKDECAIFNGITQAQTNAVRKVPYCIYLDFSDFNGA